MDIKTYVEQRFPLLEQDSALEYSRNAMIHSKQIGLTHGLEIAVGFSEWCNMTWEYNAWDNKWESLLNRDTYTTSQLLNKYLDTLKTK